MRLLMIFCKKNNKITTIHTLSYWIIGSVFILLNVPYFIYLPIFTCLIIRNWHCLFPLILSTALTLVALENKRVIQNFNSSEKKLNITITDLKIFPAQYRDQNRHTFTLKAKCNDYNLLLKLPNDETNYHYGQKLTVTGTFMPIKPPEFDGNFDYRNYLSNKNISAIFKVQQIEKSRITTNFFTPIEWLRKRLLIRVTSGLVPQSRNWRYIIGISTGNKSFISYSERDDLVKGGIFHLFAVSGLHVAIIATIMLFFLKLCFIPIRWRYANLPIILLIYIMIIGFPASAIRAWVMIAVHCYGKALLQRSDYTNSLAIAALLLLIYNPLNLVSAGFQLSFITVFFLIRILQHQSYILKVINWKSGLRVNHSPKWDIIKSVATEYILSFGTLFLITSMLQLFYFHHCQPISIVTNLWNGICSFGALFCTVCKTFMPSTIMNPLLNIFLEPIISLNEFIVDQELFIFSNKVNLTTAITYYLALLFIFHRHRKVAQLATLVIVVTLLTVILRPSKNEQQHYCLRNESNYAEVKINPHQKKATVKLAGRSAQYSVAKFLRYHGIKTVTELSVEKSLNNCCYLLDAYNIRNYKIEAEIEKKSLQENGLFINKKSLQQVEALEIR